MSEDNPCCEPDFDGSQYVHDSQCKGYCDCEDVTALNEDGRCVVCDRVIRRGDPFLISEKTFPFNDLLPPPRFG
jgi:hypothetical protein